jgi:hypothetical protein
MSNQPAGQWVRQAGTLRGALWDAVGEQRTGIGLADRQRRTKANTEPMRSAAAVDQTQLSLSQWKITPVS